MGRIIGIVAGALAVAGLAGWLLWPSPPGAAELSATTAHYAVRATIDPPRMGTASVDIDLVGAPATASVTVEAVMPLMGFATPALPAMPTGGGHYSVRGVPLMMTGPWELQVHIGTDGVNLPFTVSG